jgi:hypothetical protein
MTATKHQGGDCAGALLDHERHRQATLREQAYRKGVSQSLSVAAEIVRAGGTAKDLDRLADRATAWRYDRRPHPLFLDELVESCEPRTTSTS